MCAPARATWRWRTTGPRAARRRSSPPISATKCWRSAGKRPQQAGADGRVTFVEADAQSLPLPADAFQIVCVAFGLRNVADTDRGLAEMVRVARARRPRRRAGVLDAHVAAVQGDLRLVLSPRVAAHRQIVRAQFGRRLRVSARQASANFRKAKRCSSACAPPASTNLRRYPLTFGVATLYVGRKAVSYQLSAMSRISRICVNSWLTANSQQLISIMNHPICVGITGASGAIYAVRLLEVLRAAGRDVHLSISPSGRDVIRQELKLDLDLDSNSTPSRLRLRYERQLMRAPVGQQTQPRPSCTTTTTRTSWPRWPAARSSPAAW